MKETIVILGSHPKTRHLFDFSRDDCDIWVFNEAAQAEWVKRCNATFQLHAEPIWRNPANSNNTEHYQWLTSQREVTVYMQDVYPDVPMSERYPLEEAIALLGNLRPYYTSSPAYALALALIKGYRRIEVYGVEMATDTEYRYQRDGIALLLGIAVGRGVDLALNSETFFVSPLYGYTVDISIPEAEYERIKALTIPEIQLAQNIYVQRAQGANHAIGQFVERQGSREEFDRAILELVNAASEYGKVSGRAMECERYLTKHREMREASGKGGIIVRQEHERTAVALGEKLRDVSVRSTTTAGRLHEMAAQLEGTANKGSRMKRARRFAGLLDEHIRLSVEGGVLSGALEINREWLGWLDTHIRAAGGEKAVEVLANG